MAVDDRVRDAVLGRVPEPDAGGAVVNDKPKIVGTGDSIIPTEEAFRDGNVWHYHVVILRDDMLEKIRQIVREEIDRGKGTW